MSQFLSTAFFLKMERMEVRQVANVYHLSFHHIHTFFSFLSAKTGPIRKKITYNFFPFLNAKTLGTQCKHTNESKDNHITLNTLEMETIKINKKKSFQLHLSLHLFEVTK